MQSSRLSKYLEKYITRFVYPNTKVYVKKTDFHVKIQVSTGALPRFFRIYEKVGQYFNTLDIVKYRILSYKISIYEYLSVDLWILFIYLWN